MAKTIADPKTVGRIKLCLQSFGSGDTFLIASDGEIMQAYNKSRPGGVRGLGKVFWKMLDVIRGNAKYEAHKAESHEAASPVTNVPSVPNVPSVTSTEPVFYSAAFIKAIGAVMELGGITEIDYEGLAFLHEHFKVGDGAKPEAGNGEGAAA